MNDRYSTYRWLVRNAMNFRWMAALLVPESLNTVALNYYSTISMSPDHFWQLQLGKYWWPTRMWSASQVNWLPFVYPSFNWLIQFWFSILKFDKKCTSIGVCNWNGYNAAIIEFQSQTNSIGISLPTLTNCPTHSNGKSTFFSTRWRRINRKSDVNDWKWFSVWFRCNRILMSRHCATVASNQAGTGFRMSFGNIFSLFSPHFNLFLYVKSFWIRFWLSSALHT